MILEEKILAYLDGSLGADDSAELLHTLSTSPDKREILEEHLRLKDMLSLGRRPFAVPEHTERALFERLPILANVVESGEQAPLIPAMRSYTRVLSMAAGFGALALTGALVWFAAKPAATVPNAAAPVASQMQSTPQASVPVQNVGPSNDVQSGMQSNGGAQRLTSSASSNRSVRSNYVRSTASLATVTPADNAGSNLPQSAPPVSTTPTEQPANDAPISIVNSKDVAVQIPGTKTATSISELRMTEPEQDGGFSVGVRYTSMSNTLPHVGATGAARTVQSFDPEYFASYAISPAVSIELEYGYAQYAVVSNNGTPNSNVDQMPNYSEVSYLGSVSAARASWLRFGFGYTVNPASDFPISFGAAGGFAFEDSPRPIVAFSAGVSRVLTSSFLFDFALVTTGTFGNSASNNYISTGEGLTGIVHSEAASQSTFTPAVGLRAGIRFRPW